MLALLFFFPISFHDNKKLLNIIVQDGTNLIEFSKKVETNSWHLSFFKFESLIFVD